MNTRRGWSPEEVAEMYGRTPAQVRRLLRRGELRGRKVAGKWLVPDRNLSEFETKA